MYHEKIIIQLAREGLCSIKCTLYNYNYNLNSVCFFQAILRQWEMEQRELLVVPDTDNGHWMSNGFALACIKAMDCNRPRQRGCLKHVRILLCMNKNTNTVSQNFGG